MSNAIGPKPDDLRTDGPLLKGQRPAPPPIDAHEPSGLYPRSVARYQKIRALGAGGSGDVDLWHDQDIDRNVAVKKLRHKGDQEFLAQFLKEVKTTGQLEHPGIVPIYDVGVDEDGQYFFVMKHVEGETLEQIIARLRDGNPDYKRRFSYETRTQIFMQILRAVQYAHRKGLVHCDIKPANVIVGPFGEVMVLDWGLARPCDAPALTAAAGAGKTPRALRVSGTVDYMAPEQCMGEEGRVDARTDTYALCVLFSELVTLHYYLRPVPTAVARLTTIVTEEPLSAIQMHHKYGAPPELTNFIRDGLTKDPGSRYQTVDEMIDKLQAVIDGYIPIVCPCTGVKRVGNKYSALLDAHPIAGLVVLGIMCLFTLFGIVQAVRGAVGLVHGPEHPAAAVGAR